MQKNFTQVKKSEIKIFIKSKQKKFESHLKIKLRGKRQYTTKSLKSLDGKIDM